MAEIHRLPNMDDAQREASEWIARLHADDASAIDRVGFERWRSAHPRHARAYAELLATWRELAQSGPLVRAGSFAQAMPAASLKQPAHRRWTLAAIAAGVSAIALAGGWYLRQIQAETLIQTAIGEHATVALPDGSSLELNSNSQARVDYRKQARIVRLERGEAFFKVAHDTQRPFWVVGGGSWVRAVGTAFNVYLRSSGTQITVSEGIVKVAGEESQYPTPSDAALAPTAVCVAAGEQVDVRGRAAVVRALDPAQLRRSVAWRQGSLYFENQALGDVVDEMMRYTPLKIAFGNDTLRGLPIGGTFLANPQGAEALLTMLRDGFGLTVRRDGADRVFIEGALAAR